MKQQEATTKKTKKDTLTKKKDLGNFNEIKHLSQFKQNAQ